MSVVAERIREGFLRFVRKEEPPVTILTGHLPEFVRFSQSLENMARSFSDERFACIGVERKSQWDAGFPALEQVFKIVGWKLGVIDRAINFTPWKDSSTLEIVDHTQQNGLLFTVSRNGGFKTSYWPYEASTQRLINQQIKNTQFRRQLFTDLTSLMSKTYAWILMDQ